MTRSDLKARSRRHTEGENEERYTTLCVLSFHTRQPLVLLQGTIQSFPGTRRLGSLFLSGFQGSNFSGLFSKAFAGILAISGRRNLRAFDSFIQFFSNLHSN